MCAERARSGGRGELESVPAETHVQHGPVSRDEVLELVRERLGEILEIEPSSISEDAAFAEDLHADSLALIELVEALEEAPRRGWTVVDMKRDWAKVFSIDPVEDRRSP